MVEDPKLAQHLEHFGINISKMEKVCEQPIFQKRIQRYLAKYIKLNMEALTRDR